MVVISYSCQSVSWSRLIPVKEHTRSYILLDAHELLNHRVSLRTYQLYVQESKTRTCVSNTIGAMNHLGRFLHNNHVLNFTQASGAYFVCQNWKHNVRLMNLTPQTAWYAAAVGNYWWLLQWILWNREMYPCHAGYRWFIPEESGPRLNIKTVFPRYGDTHVKDKTVGDTVLSLTWEFLYW